MMKKLLLLLTTHIHFLMCLLLFLLLLARNPFSDRTLIPNFEPYPDSLHYIVPARSLLQGKGPYITREGRNIIPSVPILYSLTLLPFFAVNNDARMAYFANVAMSVASLGLFYLILQKLSIRRSIQFLVLFLFVSNYYIYWYPTLAMAENLTTLLFFGGVALLIGRVTPVRASAAALIAIAFYATKYANIPITVAFGMLYGIKILFPIKTFSKRRFSLLSFIAAGIGSFVVFAVWELYFYGKNVFAALNTAFGFLQFKPTSPAGPSSAAVQSSAGNGFFSLSYVPSNLVFYFQMLLGQSTKMLWSYIPLLSRFIAIPGLAALIASLASKQYRWIAVSLLVLLFANVAFLSTFYAPDARYFLYAVPSLLLGFALLLQTISTIVSRRKKGILFLLLIGFLIAAAGISSAKRVKSQISLNLRYAETPWYYLSVKELNTAVDDVLSKEKNEAEVIVVSSLPPYLVDFYSTGKYRLLPLHSQQEFRGNKKEAFGDFDYSDMHKLYATQIHEGKIVLVEKYGLGNEVMLQQAFANLSNDFDLQLVRQGCHELCNVYRLQIKAEPAKK